MKNQKRIFTTVFLFAILCVFLYSSLAKNEIPEIFPFEMNSEISESSPEIEEIIIDTPSTTIEDFSNGDEILNQTESSNSDEILNQTDSTIKNNNEYDEKETAVYSFRSQELYNQHYEKHGNEFGEISQEEYLLLANKLFVSSKALKKTESDGDYLFYDTDTNTFGVLSKDGFIRTCFKPDDGIDYWNRQ